MKKGTHITRKRRFITNLYRTLHRCFYRRHESRKDFDMALMTVQTLKKEWRDYCDHMNKLPHRFSKNYGEYEYALDIENVKKFYTRWEKEDMYDSKKSLKRIRRYEKKFNLAPFDQKIARETREKEREWLSINEGGIDA